MPAPTTVARRPRKAIILAAGKDESDARPLLLERLGDQTILDQVVANVLQVVAPEDIYVDDQVVANVLQVVAPEDIYVVVGRQQEAIRRHLGDRYTYVVQDEPAGTGHAVLHVRPQLAGFEGDLLILYGDTPL